MSFSKSIGGNYGSGPITQHSVNISQGTGSPINGQYFHAGAATGAGAVVPQDGPGGTPVASAPKTAAKSGGSKNTTHARADGKPALKPSKTAR
jgi:hypothetical protein